MPGGIHPPLGIIASWPEPNYVDPVKHSQATTVLLSIFGSLAFFTVLARVWARAVIQRKAGLDDWVMLGSLLPTLALTIGVGIANDKYFNRHVWDYKPDEILSQRKITMANEFNYVLSSGMVKISVLLFYRRMAFQTITRPFRIATIISTISVVAYSIGFLIVLFFACRPLNAFWNQLNRAKLLAGFTYKCYNEPAHLLAAAIISTIQDFIATSLPALLCWRLQIPVFQRVALYACFGVGYIVTIISAVRCHAIWYVFYKTYDVPWYTWQIWILTWLEIAVGTICASVPALRIFLKHVHEKVSLSDSSAGTVLGKVRAGIVSPIKAHIPAFGRAEEDEERDGGGVVEMKEVLGQHQSTERLNDAGLEGTN